MASSERPPGSPQQILVLATVWRDAATSAQDAANTLDSAKADISGGALKLRGDYAPKMAEAIENVPGELRRISKGYSLCSAAVATYAGTLAETQRAWDRESSAVEDAARSRRMAEWDLDRLVPAWSPDSSPLQGMTALNSAISGQPDLYEEIADAWRRRDQAMAEQDHRNRLAADARAMRDDAERTCAREIDAALDSAGIRDPNRLQQWRNWVEDHIPSWDGFVKFCETLSTVLGVVAMFAGPLAPVLLALSAAAAAVVVIDKAMKLARGEITWKQMGAELAMVAASKVGGRALGAGWKAYQKTGVSKRISAAAHSKADSVIPKRFTDAARQKVHNAVCTFTGHPVDVATGKLYTSFTDLELPGPLPFTLDRVWYSTSKYSGPFGHGWHHTYDAAVLVTADEIAYRTPDGRFVDLLYVLAGESVYGRQERLTIARDENGFRITGVDGVTRRFTPGTGPIVDPSEPIVFLLREVVSRAGHRITCTYDDRDRLIEIVDSGGREIGFIHDEHGRVASLTAPHPDRSGERFDVATYTYDALGNLASMTDARGFVFQYAYEGHLLVAETDRTGLTFHFRWDGQDETARCASTWGDGDLYRRTLLYEPGSTVVIDSLGHATRHDHEGGLVVRTTDPLGAVSTTEFDYAQPVRATDALARETRYEYDWRGNLLEVATPDGATVAVTFDEHDQPVTAVDQVGGVWGWQYNESGLLTVRRDPLERETHLAYARGLLESIVDPAGGRTQLLYDEQGSLVEVITPDGATSAWRRNALGWPIATTDPLGNDTRRTFDPGGNITQVEEPDGNVRMLEYDGESNLTSAVDVLYDVKLAYQGMGRLASRTQAGTTVRFEYDTEEQLTGLVNEHGYVYSFSYNPTGLVSTERGFDGIMRIYERDIAGRVASVRRASGMVTRHEYDDLDRVIRVAHSDGTAQRYAYRADGALTLAGNDTIDVRFDHDVLGRLLRETQGTRWVASAYDALDRRVRMTSSMGADQTITRNVMGDVTAVEGNGYAAQFTRDALGQELTRSLPGGVQTRWHRDSIGRPVRQELVGASGTIRERTYDWDVGGRLRGILDSLAGPVRYEHDGLGQLVSATYGDGRIELRTPDAVGNLFKTEDRSDREYGATGQVLSLIDDDGRQVRYDYDPEGNLIAKTADDGETWRYRWGADGNMSAVVRPDGTEVTFGYDALSRRVSKTYRGQTTHWVWDGDVILHEWVDSHLQAASVSGHDDAIAAARDASLSEVLRRGPPDRGTESSPITWLFDPESFAPAARVANAGVSSFITDHLGVPHCLVSRAGDTAWAGIQSTHGQIVTFKGELDLNPFRFPGQYEDAATGLYCNRHRYYDPQNGQYSSVDPIRLAGGARIYSYPGDPSALTDPFGLSVSKGGGEVISYHDSIVEAFQEASARSGLESGDRVEYISTFGPSEGFVVGASDSAGKLGRGYRIDWDKTKKLHINWWDNTAGLKRDSGWIYGAAIVNGGTIDDYYEALEHRFGNNAYSVQANRARIQDGRKCTQT